MTTVQPYPYVILGGAIMSCDLKDMGTQPLVLDGIRADWGRSEYLSHAGTGSLEIAFIDRSGTLANQATNKQLLGKPVAVWYTDAPGSSWGACYFQGRLVGAEAEPDVPDPFTDGRTRMWRVTLTASDKTQDLGQIVQPPGTWPQETAQARAVRLRDASIIAGIGQFYFYPGHVSSIMSAIDVKGRDNLSLLKDFYMSMGDTYSYLPKENNIRYLHRRVYDMSAVLYSDSDGIIRMRAAGYTFDGRQYKGIGVQGCEVTSDGPTTVPTQAAITRVEMSWKDTVNGSRDWVTVVYADELNELDWGRRTLTVSSWLGDGRQIDPVILELLNRGRFEGGLPKHPDVTVDTRRTGGFHSRDEAEAYLEGGESIGIAYLSGSAHAYWAWLNPFYAVIGGSIEYRYPGWVIRLRLQPCWRSNASTPPTWAGLNTSIRWTEPPAVGALSESFTWFDAVFLTNGNVYQST